MIWHSGRLPNTLERPDSNTADMKTANVMFLRVYWYVCHVFTKHLPIIFSD